MAQFPKNTSFVQNIFLKGDTNARLSIIIADGFKDSTIIRKNLEDSTPGDREFELKPGKLFISVTPGPPPENKIEDSVPIKFRITGDKVKSTPKIREIPVDLFVTITGTYTII